MSTSVFSAKWNWYISVAHACAETMDTHLQGDTIHNSQLSEGFLCASTRLLNDKKWDLNHLWKKKGK